MADAIARIVSEIQFLCRMHHHDVNPTLAAFIARAVVLENATQFPLDKELNEKDVKDLIKLSTERLFADYLVCNLALHIACICFLG